MSQSKLDSTILAQIDPLDACEYLESIGWQKTSEIGNKALIYEREDFYSEIIVPISKSTTDFKIRYAQTIGLLSEYYERSKDDILKDILYFGSDIARFRIDSPNTRDGTIALSDADKFYSNIKHVVLASARSVIDARPKYSQHIPEKVQKMYSQSRIGQTEKGSYIISVIIKHSRVAKDANFLFDSDLLKETKPFERPAFENLNKALQEINKIPSKRKIETRMEDAVQNGVSYNLCKHLAEIQEITSGGSLDVGFQWSPRFKRSENLLDKVEIEYEKIDQVREFAEMLNSNAKPDFTTIYGYVIGLLKPEGHTEGKVTVQALYMGKSVKISMTLKIDSYLKAVKSHEENIQVSCTGEVERVGNYIYMRKVNKFDSTRPASLF